MTLSEANQVLMGVDCSDPDAVASALTHRARAIAEFASTAPQGLLRETLASGEALRDRLELNQLEGRREIDRITQLSRGLESTLVDQQADLITCFG